MAFKDFKLGMKLGIGFGILILLSILLGVLAISGMMNVTNQSTYLATEYVPEVKIATDLQNAANHTMYEMRGYGLTAEKKHYQEALDEFRIIDAELKKGNELAERAEVLEQFAPQLTVAQQAKADYLALAQKTNELNESLTNQRAILDENAARMTESFNAFLNSQQTKFNAELNAGAGTEQIRERFRKIDNMRQIIRLVNNTRVGAFKAQALRDPKIMQASLQKFNSRKAIFDDLFSITREAEDIRELEGIREAAQNYETAMSNIVKEWTELDNLASQREESGTALIEACKIMTNAGLTNTQSIANEAVSLLNRASLFMVVGLLIAIILGVILAIIITKAITIPIKKGVDFAREIANGNLEATVEVYQKDEVGELAEALRGMLKRLIEIVGSIRAGANNIASASQQMSTNSQEMSQGATEQASSTEEVSSSMEEMSSNIQQNTDNAQQTEKIANKAAEDILESSRNVNQTVDSMKTIAEKISIINDIAFQTNILALNAAVEAARAGEHGKGFAVVAAEVRKLAERSQKAAAEIDGLSRSSVDIAERSGQLLQDIVPDIQNTSKLVQEITAASIEQSSGADQINNAIQQLNQITQQNAASSEEMATSAEELSSQADQLLDTVSFFKINIGSLNLQKKIDHSVITKAEGTGFDNTQMPQNKAQSPPPPATTSRKGIKLDMDSKDDEYESF